MSFILLKIELKIHDVYGEVYINKIKIYELLKCLKNSELWKIKRANVIFKEYFLFFSLVLLYIYTFTNILCI
jgi:hypothetical protein